MPLLIGKREEIINVKKQNPTYRSATIGEQVGVSRQRVTQILTQVGLNNSKELFKKKLCKQCGGEIQGKNKLQRKFCSPECKHKYYTVDVKCDFCGGIITRRLSEVKNYGGNHQRNHHFCNKVCQGKWLGENYGRGKQSVKKASVS